MADWFKGCAASKDTSSTSSTQTQTAEDSLASVNTESVAVVFPGLAENAYSLKDGSTLISGYNAHMQPTLWLASANTATVTDLGIELPDTNFRSYGDSTVLPDGKIAILYQSTNGFSNLVGERQTGRAHGFIVIDPSNLTIEDVPFESATNPEGLVVANSKLYILCANRNTDSIATLLEFNKSSYVLLRTMVIGSAYNATDLELDTDREHLLVLCSETEEVAYDSEGYGGLTTTNGSGRVVQVNPDDLTVTNTYPIGAAFTDMDIASDLNTIYFAGAATDNSSGFGSLTLSDGQFEDLYYDDFRCNASDIEEIGVGGQFFNGANNSSGVLRTVIVKNSSGDTRVSFIDPQEMACKSVETGKSALTTPIFEIDSATLAYVASEVDWPSDQGDEPLAPYYSAIYFFEK